MMRDIIRELVEQTGMSLYNNSDEFFGRQDNFDFRKFANLIIKECIDLCDEIEDDFLKEFGDISVSIGAGACSYKISAHFGVE
jgi:hypothetical protein